MPPKIMNLSEPLEIAFRREIEIFCSPPRRKNAGILSKSFEFLQRRRVVKDSVAAENEFLEVPLSLEFAMTQRRMKMLHKLNANLVAPWRDDESPKASGLYIFAFQIACSLQPRKGRPVISPGRAVLCKAMGFKSPNSSSPIRGDGFDHVPRFR
jgi:hypothetical protein